MDIKSKYTNGCLYGNSYLSVCFVSMKKGKKYRLNGACPRFGPLSFELISEGTLKNVNEVKKFPKD